MQTFNVVIRATITKTISVEAETQDEAEVLAHETFSVLCDEEDESYEQETVRFYDDA